MDEKYEYMFLMYVYKVLGLNNYEKMLEVAGIEQINFRENDDLFKYFSLLNNGDTELFTEEELKELNFLDCYQLKEIFSNDELRGKCEEFLNRTYKKYFFSNTVDSDYIYYGPATFEYIAPSDAIVLGLNYRKFVDEKEGEDYDTTLLNQDRIISSIINNIQENSEEMSNMKIAVIEQNESVLSLNNNSVIL